VVPISSSLTDEDAKILETSPARKTIQFEIPLRSDSGPLRRHNSKPREVLFWPHRHHDDVRAASTVRLTITQPHLIRSSRSYRERRVCSPAQLLSISAAGSPHSPTIGIICNIMGHCFVCQRAQDTKPIMTATLAYIVVSCNNVMHRCGIFEIDNQWEKFGAAA
jgi:hypothetical protein